MTVEDIKELAQQGNVRAMAAMGEYYSGMSKAGTPNREKALYYYKLAAEAGDVQGTVEMVMASEHDLALASIMAERGEIYPELDKIAEEAIRWAKLLETNLQGTGTEGGLMDFAKRQQVQVFCKVSVLYYRAENYEGMIWAAQKLDHPLAKAIGGLAKYRLATTGVQMQEACEMLKYIEDPLCWSKDYQTKHSLTLLLDAANCLSKIYAELCNDVNSAYQILTETLNRIVDEKTRKKT